jgi:RNA polymerase sigma-70 factor (ECF subfamily)
MLDDIAIKRLLLRTAARDEGSAEAFERLFKLCAPLLLGVAKRIVGRQELAEDVLQDSFAKIWGLAERFDPLANQPVAWMVAIVRNRAIDVRASHAESRVDSYHGQDNTNPDGNLDALMDIAEEPGESADRRRISLWLRDCLGGLDAVERQSLVLAYQQGMSHGELASHLDRPLGTVKTWVRRGMTRLRDCVESRMGAAR